MIVQSDLASILLNRRSDLLPRTMRLMNNEGYIIWPNYTPNQFYAVLLAYTTAEKIFYYNFDVTPLVDNPTPTAAAFLLNDAVKAFQNYLAHFVYGGE